MLEASGKEMRRGGVQKMFKSRQCGVFLNELRVCNIGRETQFHSNDSRERLCQSA